MGKGLLSVDVSSPTSVRSPSRPGINGSNQRIIEPFHL